MLVGTFTRYPVAGVIATLGIVLAAIYILLLYQRVVHRAGGRRGQGVPRPRRPRGRSRSRPLLALIIALGFFPKPVLDVINPAVGHTLAAGRRRPTRPRRSPGPSP